MTNIDDLRKIIDDPNTSADNRTLAEEMLQQEEERLAALGGARVQSAMGATQTEAELAAILDAMKTLLQKKGGSANISVADVRKAVNDELALRKINLGDLSPDLLKFIDSKRAVSLTVRMMSGTTTQSTSDDFLSRPLAQKLLCDVEARNNSYLYGGAGTGKTFIAEQIADALGWELITINCNQYTSPLDILGGQTIDGYQEGKLVLAWRNVKIKPDGTETPLNGCVLLLDELPKIDPNTAGILNDALAKVKNPKAQIMNAKNEKFALKNLFVIATGNVKLNTIDPDYEANFKQDLSLQDRFVGSTYEVFIDYETESKVMNGFAFIWLYLIKVRKKIKEIRATGQAFVSMRLMVNARETYKVYRDIKEKKGKNAAGITYAINDPKTLIETMDNFFILFKDAQRDILKRDTDYDEFKRIVAEKENMIYDAANPNFDTPEEKREVDLLVEENKREIKNMYN